MIVWICFILIPHVSLEWRVPSQPLLGHPWRHRTTLLLHHNWPPRVCPTPVHVLTFRVRHCPHWAHILYNYTPIHFLLRLRGGDDCEDHVQMCQNWAKLEPESCVDPNHSSFHLMNVACQKSCGVCKSIVCTSSYKYISEYYVYFFIISPGLPGRPFPMQTMVSQTLRRQPNIHVSTLQSGVWNVRI